jgi:hypothetical protein
VVVRVARREVMRFWTASVSVKGGSLAVSSSGSGLDMVSGHVCSRSPLLWCELVWRPDEMIGDVVW